VLRYLARAVIVIVAFYAFLAFMSSDLGKSAMTDLAHQIVPKPGGAGASPPPGETWTAADGQACHGVFDAVSDWPGKDTAAPISAVMYGGSTDVQVARQAVVAAAQTYLVKSADLTVSAAGFEIAAFRSSLSDIETAAAQPMTVPDFRTKYQRVLDTLSGIRTRCIAIDQWVREHVPQ
jgi:hypothetical protein